MAYDVLVHRAMSRLAVVAVVFAASTSVASAGTYLGLGIGTSADGNLGDSGTVEGAGRSGRLLLGARMSKLSLEGQASRYDLAFQSSLYASTQVGLGLKLSIPLGNNFELFGRGGVQRTWLNHEPGMTYDVAGNGWFGSAGVEYRVNLGLTAASVFMDYQRSSTDFTTERMTEIEGAAGMWTLGMTVSL